MNVSVRIVVAVTAIAAGAPIAARAQSPAVSPPPVLSTAPSPPAGAVPDAGGMSGLPLQVGDLPPGVVAVRVIRRDFSENIPGQAVELHAAGRVLKGTTNADGRAQFEALPVGETVQARATIGNELLGSQRFQLPTQGGVRLVLVAGVGAGMPPENAPVLSAGNFPGSAPNAAPAPAAAAAPAAPATAGAPSSGRRTQIAVPLILGFVCIGVGFFWFTRRPKALVTTASPAAPLDRESDEAARTGLRSERTALFDELVRLEREISGGVVQREAGEAHREALIRKLVECDAALDRLAHRAA